MQVSYFFLVDGATDMAIRHDACCSNEFIRWETIADVLCVEALWAQERRSA